MDPAFFSVEIGDFRVRFCKFAVVSDRFTTCVCYWVLLVHLISKSCLIVY